MLNFVKKFNFLFDDKTKKVWKIKHDAMRFVKLD